MTLEAPRGAIDQERLGNASKSLYHAVRGVDPSTYGALDAAKDGSWVRVFFSDSDCRSLPASTKKFIIENAGPFTGLAMQVHTRQTPTGYSYMLDVNPLGTPYSQDVLSLSSSFQATKTDGLGEYSEAVRHPQVDVAIDTGEWVSNIIEKRKDKVAV